jgi:hypothetical protein
MPDTSNKKEQQIRTQQVEEEKRFFLKNTLRREPRMLCREGQDVTVTRLLVSIRKAPYLQDRCAVAVLLLLTSPYVLW